MKLLVLASAAFLAFWAVQSWHLARAHAQEEAEQTARANAVAVTLAIQAAELLTRATAERIDASLDTLIPANPNQPYDMKELILKMVDEGDFFEIQEAHARNIITGLARINGRTVGIVANQPMVLAGVPVATTPR